jgi:hypothetical protein
MAIGNPIHIERTLDSLVGLEWLKLFMRYQMLFRILFESTHNQSMPIFFQKPKANARSKRCDPDTGAHEQNGLIIQKLLGRRPERPVDHHTRERAVHGRVRVGADDFAACGRLGRGVSGFGGSFCGEEWGCGKEERKEKAPPQRPIQWIGPPPTDIISVFQTILYPQEDRRVRRR